MEVWQKIEESPKPKCRVIVKRDEKIIEKLGCVSEQEALAVMILLTQKIYTGSGYTASIEYGEE